MAIIKKIISNADVRKLSLSELKTLADEIREAIIQSVTAYGGHLASNLGVVELTIALHYVFSTPTDSIVWDVGHQCYAHKMLTGRLSEFNRLRRNNGLPGYPKRSESPHDAFGTGHASTSISAALGILAANTQLGNTASVVAVIGDGALTGGMAYEAMSHAGQLGLPLIIVLNDNAMSISKNVGAISSYLSRLSATERYQKIRNIIDKIILGIPYFGKRVHPWVLRLKRAVKSIFFKETLFADLGFEYAGPVDGHNIGLLCEVLREARAIKKPVVIHVITKKGKGHSDAEENPQAFHGFAALQTKQKTFTEVFGQVMLKAAELEPKLAVITAAMVGGTGLSNFQKTYPKRIFDVGIAEEHAVTFAAGLAAGGCKPVVAIYSTFIQRAFDQIIHDVAIQNLPVIFALDRAGAVPDDGETHQGIFDIYEFRAIPNMHILAPASAAELENAVFWALTQNHPTAIRYPKDICPPEIEAYSLPLISGQGVFALESEGAAVLLAASGALTDEAIQAAELCLSQGVKVDVYHMRFLKPFDKDVFLNLAAKYKQVVIAEEGVITCSLAFELASLLQLNNIKALALGFDEEPLSQATRSELLDKAGLSASRLASTILSL